MNNQNFLFDDLEMLEQTPSSLLTNLTDQPTPEEITAHTTTQAQPQPIPQQTQSQLQQQANASGPAYPPPPPSGPQQMNAGQLFGAEMTVTMLNVAMPALIVIVLKRFTGKQVPREMFEATAAEQEMIKPALQNYLNSISFQVESPLHALILVCSVVYGTKVVEVLNNMPPGKLSAEGGKSMQPKKMETRGRHKKDCTCIICTQKRQREGL